MGKLIVLEGGDRCGKSTQIEKISEHLHNMGHTVATLAFPDRFSAIGKIIQKHLKGEEKIEEHALHLLFSADRWNHKDELLHKINHYDFILVDRYVASGTAYSMATANLDKSWCENSDMGLPKPDLVFLLNSTQQEVANRKLFGEEVFETTAIQAVVQEKFVTLMDDTWYKIPPRYDIVKTTQYIVATMAWHF